MTNAILDESAYEWGQYLRLSRKFKLNLRHLFLSITFESQIKSDPLLLAVAFLQQAFAKNRSLRKYNPTAFPQTFIPHKFERYVFDSKPVWVNGKSKKSKMLNVDKYEFLIFENGRNL